MGNRQALGLTILRVSLGVLFLFQGLGKLGWFTSSAVLRDTLTTWMETAGPLSRAYIESVCLPGVEIFSRVVPLGELSTGIALILGFYTRPAALLALLMVLNFHFAMGLIFKFAWLTNGYGPPVVGGLLALAIGGASLPFSVKK
jgi:uncharacterized membrane protein YphA (DoxX/SURF4 family)